MLTTDMEGAAPWVTRGRWGRPDADLKLNRPLLRRNGGKKRKDIFGHAVVALRHNNLGCCTHWVTVWAAEVAKSQLGLNPEVNEGVTPRV